MSVIVRALQPAEWRIYRDVRLAALRDSPEAFGGSYEAAAAYPDRQWIDWCSQPSWFAFDRTRVVGMVRVFCHDDKDLPELVSMWVAPSFRGSDAAGELLRQVLDWAKSEGHSGIYLRVMTANARAIRFYERLGFSPNGITDELPDGRAELEFEHRFR